MIWRCPVCQQSLQRQEQRWRCDNNHCFDIAKEGYANLLLANQKSSQEPGDNKSMLNNRRQFLMAGHYYPLVEKLLDIITPLLSKNSSTSLLDCGCGEGYYLRELAGALREREGCDDCDVGLHGIDISRDGVRLSAKSFKAAGLKAEFAVASSFQLPLQDQSLDAVLRVFAPSDDAEVRRVLKPEGVFVVVSPGPRHLFALKEKIYSRAQDHTAPEMPQGFEGQAEYRLSYSLALNSPEAIQQLLSMTPFAWKVSRAAREQLQALDNLTTDVDFSIRVYGMQGHE